MADITPEAVREAADVLGIGDRASITEIRSRYRALIKQSHPDVPGREPEEAHHVMIRLNDAYEILIGYCLQYEISFQPEDLEKARRVRSFDAWMAQYGNDPIWGPFPSTQRQQRK